MSGNEKSKKEMSMVAPKSAEQQQVVLKPVEVLAAERGVPDYALAGMRRAYGWAEGKQLGEAEFEEKMEAYQRKPLGGR